MPALADISHFYGDDVAVTPTGDLATTSGYQLTIQRVIRRLCTTQTTAGNSAYPWEPGYGCGLPALIGQALDPQQIQALVFSQLLQEASVAPLPVPQVTVTAITGGGATIGIVYTDRSGTPQNFSFDLAA